MTLRVMSESEFKSKRIGDKVTFGKKPTEYPALHTFTNLTEGKDYTVIGKYYHDPRGPILKVFEILDDNDNSDKLHYGFFLASDSS